ncbi:MAG: hypothetical protein JXR60_01510 [Bacteroidales bacterium]|nr:hypothetical protein [Bacteroidales bacterium]
MDLQKFYQVINATYDDLNEKHQYEIVFNADHIVYKGHFPMQAVVPGVLQIEVFSDILNKISSKQNKLKLVKNVKYISMIVPDDSLYILELKMKKSEGFVHLSTLLTDKNKNKKTQFSAIYEVA